MKKVLIGKCRRYVRALERLFGDSTWPRGNRGE